MKLCILLVAFVLTVESTAVNNNGADVNARFVRRLGSSIGGHMFDIISGAFVAAKGDYLTDLKASLSTLPTPVATSISITDYIQLQHSQGTTPNTFSAYVGKWGQGMGGGMYGMLNANLIISGADGPGQFLSDTIAQWVKDNKEYTDVTSDNLCVAKVQSLRNLATFLGPEIGGMVYSTMGAFAAIQVATSSSNTDSTDISTYLLPVLQVIVNAATQNYATTDYDVFDCIAANGGVCVSASDLTSILPTDALNLFNQLIGGTYQPTTEGQLGAVQSLQTSL